MSDLLPVTVHPVTPDRWDDLATLFQAARINCWCMWPRLLVGGMYNRTPDQNEKELRAQVTAGKGLGLLAYLDGEPVGWCSVGPRAAFVRFSAGTKDASVWLIACFFVAESARGTRIATRLLDAAVDLAAEAGAVAVEGPPRRWVPGSGRGEGEDIPGRLNGIIRMFRSASFRDVAEADSVALMHKDLQ